MTEGKESTKKVNKPTVMKKFLIPEFMKSMTKEEILKEAELVKTKKSNLTFSQRQLILFLESAIQKQQAEKKEKENNG